MAIVARRADALESVAESVRRAVPGARVCVVPHDVADVERVAAAWEACERGLEGPVTRLVFAAGIMPMVRTDEFDTGKDAAMIAINLTGAIAWMNVAAARFLAARAGQIVGISSVAGDRGRIGAPAYMASKAGLTSFLESLRNRLDRHGVSVVTVKPGYVKTSMIAGVPNPIGAISADACARSIVNACERRRQTVYVPGWWRFVLLVIRHVPSFIFRRLNV